MSDRVVNTVWNWREAAGRDEQSRERTGLRRSALVQTAVMVAIGCILAFLWGHHIAAYIVWSLAAVVLLLGLAAPSAYRHIHRFGQWLGRAVGGLLLYLLMTPMYFLVFFPASLILRLTGRDPMSLKKRDMRHTCWIPRAGDIPVETYARQFMLEDKEARKLRRPVADAEEAGS